MLNSVSGLLFPKFDTKFQYNFFLHISFKAVKYEEKIYQIIYDVKIDTSWKQLLVYIKGIKSIKTSINKRKKRKNDASISDKIIINSKAINFIC